MFYRLSRAIPFLILSAAFLSPAVHAQDLPVLTDPDAKALDPSIKVPDYEVSTIKVNKSGNNMMRIMFKPDGFSSTNLTLKTLIGNAYMIRQDLISGGPAWLGTTGFDVEAKVLGDDVELLKKVPPLQRQVMLQHLLAERFKLVVHTETKMLPTFDLVVAKDGPKMTPAPLGEKDDDAMANPDAKRHPGMMMMSQNSVEGTSLPMASLASQLSAILHHTVIDKTGLMRKYDFVLKFTPDDGPPPDSDNASPTIFTAVQEQLGLKLVPSKGPTPTLVIDHVEPPTED